MAHDHAAHEHDEHEGHEHGPEDTRIRVLHGASPFCHWSYGYEPVLQRLRLLYGDQIKVNTYHTPVYQDWDQHLRDYEMDAQGMRGWVDEIEGLVQMPLNRAWLDHPTKDCVPGTMMLHAVEAVKPGAGERFARLVWHAIAVEGDGLNDEATLFKLAERAGAPRKQVEQAMADGRAEASRSTDAQSYHALGLNYYALQVRDFEGRTVILEHAFESAKVEDALEWLSRGKLRKQALPSVADYVAQHAPVSLREVREVFRLDEAKARKAAEQAEKSGKVARVDKLGHTYWVPKPSGK
jgi:predicted DsbA family dithiol-disulfide isomerase